MHKEIIEATKRQLDQVVLITDDVVRQIIHGVIEGKHAEEPISLKERKRILERSFNTLRRLDVLQPLIEDDEITEIMVNGPDCIFFERKGVILESDLVFDDAERLNHVIQKIVSGVNRTVNTSEPIVDARLIDGSRVNVVLPPIALNGPIMTIRKFQKEQFTMKDLIELGAITDEAAVEIDGWMRARLNLFISGGTGSGKTTFLNVLSQSIQKDQRVITIEDSAELQLTHIKNWVRLETRNANTEGVGEISIRVLIKSALRMRPDRIIVGEVRGCEAIDMLQAMNTGHDGSLSTGHANNVTDMLKRLETMVYSDSQMPIAAIKQQIVSAIDVIIHLGRLRDRSRRVLAIEAMSHLENGDYVLVPLYLFSDLGDDENGRVKGALTRTGNGLPRIGKLIASGQTVKKEPYHAD